MFLLLLGPGVDGSGGAVLCAGHGYEYGLSSSGLGKGVAMDEVCSGWYSGLAMDEVCSG